MSDILVANRYARSLFKVANNDDAKLDNFLEVLNSIKDLFDDPSIKRVLVSPVMPKDLKLQILEYICTKAQAHTDIVNFVKVTVDSGRVEVLNLVLDAFASLLNERNGVTDATVYTVKALQEKELQDVAAKLEKLLGKKVRLDSEIDPGLLGGLVVKVGHNVLDLSLRNRLNRVAKTAII